MGATGETHLGTFCHDFLRIDSLLPGISQLGIDVIWRQLAVAKETIIGRLIKQDSRPRHAGHCWSKNVVNQIPRGVLVRRCLTLAPKAENGRKGESATEQPGVVRRRHDGASSLKW